MTARTADVIIIGAGVIGCSIAYHLLKLDQRLRIVVLEREAMPGLGSTAKATGGIRHQFSTEANIRLTQLSLPIYLRFEEETGYSVNFRPHGYLFVTGNRETLADLQQAATLQRSLNVPTQVISPDEAATFVARMRTDDLLGATFCAQDGTAEPAAAVQGFAAAARAMGARFVMEEAVAALDSDGTTIRGVRAASDTYHAPSVVVAAGPHAAQIAQTAGVTVPARPYRRQVVVGAPPGRARYRHSAHRRYGLWLLYPPDGPQRSAPRRDR